MGWVVISSFSIFEFICSGTVSASVSDCST